MYNPFSLEGKTILVTGVSSGIGRNIAIECSKMGANLVITGRNQERLFESYQNLQKNHHLMICLDLSDANAINELIQKTPIIDGIVHAAGVTDNSPFNFLNRSKLDYVMDVNFYAPVEVTRMLLRNKKISKGGSIVFISSISGVYTSAVALTAYSASKGAVNGLTKSLAIELAHKSIRVNSINPGIVETNIFASGIITDEQLNIEKKLYPLGRFGKPEEVAYGAIYLLSDASKWITGTNLLIDGGFLLQ